MAGEFTPGSDDWFKEKLKNQKELIRESKNWRDSLDGISRDERKAELEGIKQKKEALSKLTLETEEQKKNAEELLKIYEKQEKIYKSQYEVTGRITQEVKVTYRQFQNFLTTSADQYNYAQKIAKEYLMVSRNIGAGAAHQERLTRTLLVPVLTGDGKDL